MDGLPRSRVVCVARLVIRVRRMAIAMAGYHVPHLGAPMCRPRSHSIGWTGTIARVEPISTELEAALRDAQSHPDRLAVAEPTFAVDAVLRTTWRVRSGSGRGPTLLVERAQGDIRRLVGELLSEKPQPLMPEAMALVFIPPVKYLLVAGDGSVARPPMPDPDWDRWSPSGGALAEAGFAQIGEVGALTEAEWQETLHPRRPDR